MFLKFYLKTLKHFKTFYTYGLQVDNQSRQQ